MAQPVAAPLPVPPAAALPSPASTPVPPPPPPEPQQAMADLPAVPPRPDSHILDESGMLAAATRQSLSARLLSSQTRTGLGLYLAIHTFLLEESAELRASRTHEAWLEGQGAGIVVVLDRSTGRLSFAGSDDKRMPGAESLRALYRLSDDAVKKLPPEATGSDRLVATLTSLAEGLESWQKNGRLPASPVAATPAPPNPAAEARVYHTRPPWPRPGTFLVDEAGVFPAAAAAALSASLESSHLGHGLRLYVVTVTYPPPGLPFPLAEKLAMEWLPESVGGVIVFDRSQPDTLSFAGTPQVDRWLSPVELKSLHEAALAAGLAAGDKPDAWIPAAVQYLTGAYLRDGVPRLRESQSWLPGSSRQIFPLVLAGSVVCAGLLYLFQRWQERHDRRRAIVFRFPEVYVAERLGAPHGGGVAAETLPAEAPAPSAAAPNP